MAEKHMEIILREHIEEEDQRFAQIHGDIKTIKDNHLFHLEKDVAGIHVTLATMAADMGWVKWGVVLVLAGLVTGAIALIFK